MNKERSDTVNILKKTKRYIKPRISFNITKKYKTKSTMQTTRISSIRNNFWKIKQINNFDEIKNFNPNKRLVNTILNKSIDTKPKEKSNSALTLYYPEHGDSVWNIAKKFCTSPKAIMDANNLEDDVIINKTMLIVPIV